MPDVDPREQSAVTRRGVALIVWAIFFSLSIGGILNLSGLKYVQGVIWPTDLPTLERLSAPDLDVAILGSSRASFDLSPSGLDRCMSNVLGRRTRTMNLARTYATSWTASVLQRELLAGDRMPRILVLAIGPEFVNEWNHQRPEDMALHGGVVDLLPNLWHAEGLYGHLAALRVFARGPESLALYAGGRYATQDRLTWLATFQGGGQYCYGTAECKEQNRNNDMLLQQRWEISQNYELPTLRELRFERYEIGTGPVHAGMRAILEAAAAAETEVVVVSLPLHGDFRMRIPPAVVQSYQAYLTSLEAEYGVRLWAPTDPDYEKSRRLYVDTDHLNAFGSSKLSGEFCEAVLVPMLAEGD